MLICFLIVLQYLNLLQDKQGKAKLHRSLFALNQQSNEPKPLLMNLDKYFATHKIGNVSNDIEVWSTFRFPGERNISTLEQSRNDSSLPLCPIIPSNLHGPVKVLMGKEVPESMEEIEEKFPHLLSGLNLTMLTNQRFFLTFVHF